MKKYLLLFVTLLFVPFFVFGQEQKIDIQDNNENNVYNINGAFESTGPNSDPESAQDVPFSGPPLVVSIESVNFDTTNHAINITSVVQNTTNEFIDNLNTFLEIYKGDKLSESEGFLFDGLEFTYEDKQPFGGELAPNETKKVTLTYSIPKSVKAGKYFIRYALEDREAIYFGVTYHPDPIELSGTGEFIGNIIAEIEEEDGLLLLDRGPLKEKDESLVVVIQNNRENSKLFDYIHKNNVYVQSNVKSVAFDEKIIKEFPKIKAQTVVYKNTESMVFVAEPWKEMSTGAFYYNISFVDENEEIIAYPIRVQWFRPDGVARITKIDTTTNFYKKNTPLDIQVDTTLFGFEDKTPLSIKIDIKTIDDETHTFSKEIIYQESKNDSFENVDFSDQTFIGGTVSEIVAEISTKDGVVFDKTIRKMDPTTLFVGGKQLEQTVFNWILFMIVLIVGIPIVVLLFGLISRKRNTTIAALFLIVVSASVAFFLNNTYIVDADCQADSHPTLCNTGNVPLSYLNIWFSNPPEGNLGNCSVTGHLHLYTNMACPNCMNGVKKNIGIEASYSNGTEINWCDGQKYVPGHGTSHSYGPYNMNLPLSQGHVCYRGIVRTANGCHCKAASNETRWYCFSCTTPVIPEPQCGSYNGRIYPWNDNNMGWSYFAYDSKGFCAKGTKIGNPSFPEPGMSSTWKCKEGNKTVDCSASRTQKPLCKCGYKHNGTYVTKPSNPGLCGANSVLVGNVTGSGPWNWICGGTNVRNECPCVANKFIQPGVCNSVVDGVSYLYGTDNWPSPPSINSSNYNSYFCSGGTITSPTPFTVQGGYTIPQFPDVNATTTWSCNGINSTTNVQCSATRQPPVSECNDLTGEYNSMPTDNLLCQDPNKKVSGVDTTDPWNGKWTWSCSHEWFVGPPAHNDLNPAYCEAKSCLAETPIDFQRYVYFESNGDPSDASVTVTCPGVCCKIKGTRAPSDVIICDDTPDGYIEVHPGSKVYPTECWFDDDGNDDDDGEPKVNVNVTISTMCTARECNTQGTCQATPQAAQSPSQCKSSCNSNADCSSGRMIETKP